MRGPQRELKFVLHEGRRHLVLEPGCSLEVVINAAFKHGTYMANAEEDDHTYFVKHVDGRFGSMTTTELLELFSVTDVQATVAAGLASEGSEAPPREADSYGVWKGGGQGSSGGGRVFVDPRAPMWGGKTAVSKQLPPAICSPEGVQQRMREESRRRLLGMRRLTARR